MLIPPCILYTSTRDFIIAYLFVSFNIKTNLIGDIMPHFLKRTTADGNVWDCRFRATENGKEV